MNTFFSRLRMTSLAGFCLLSGGLFAPSQAAQTTLFQDQFNATSWNTTNWATYDTTNYLQRTQFGNQPTMKTENGVSFARLRLDSYNPDPKWTGNYLRGTEVMTKTQFSVGDGLEIEARLRGQNLPRGIVFAFFTYGSRGTYPNNLRDEIDYEFLTNFDKDKMWLNIFDDYNKQTGTGPNQSSTTTAAGLDRATWHTYKIRWTKTRIDWFVDDVIVRTSTDILPADPMTVRFDIWGAANTWPLAYDENLPVASTSAANQSFYMDVDYVTVKTLPDGVVGNGTGLSGTYYDNINFTGTSLQRLDKQVNFDWGQGAPASNFGPDTFSARWTGQVQAQFTEKYTFSTRTDDGVRLWVDNKLIIDQWHNGSADDSTGQIDLIAGQKYNIKMEYYEDEGGAVAQLSWSSARTPKVLIPQSQLYPAATPTNTAPTISISSPVNGQIYEAAPLFAGAARDAETSILALSGLLFDQSRARYWNGKNWTTTAANFPVPTTNGDWSYRLPALLDGRFTLRMAATDTTRQSSSSALVFSINNKKPPVIVINSPVGGRTYTSKPAFSGTAADAETSVLEVKGLIYDATRKLYWSGSAWGTTAVYFLLSGKETWSYTLPALPNGNYIARVLATDTSRNSASKAVSFVVKSGASTYNIANTFFSSGEASGKTITLHFSGNLGDNARNVSTWNVSVGGQKTVPASVAVDGETVTLTLNNSLPSGAVISVSWPNLQNANGQIIGGSWSGKAN